jgi:LDH2 family malate/lactate/ureidoglycolate dehydrogenase
MNGSDPNSPPCDSFLGVKLPAELKRTARDAAENEGITLSEMVRRKLQELRSEEVPA